MSHSSSMSHSPDEAELLAALQIIDRVMEAAVDDALDTNVSGHSLAAAALSHICQVLLDIFEHTPEQIGEYAKFSAALHAAAKQQRH